MIKGNKGEWSEFYAFLKILSDKKLFAADEDLDKLKNKFYLVLKVIRDEAKQGKKIYDISDAKNSIKIMDKDGEIIKEIPDSIIKSKVKELFSAMKNSTDTTFGIELGEKLMKQMSCTQIKAKSTNKADLSIIIHDKMSPVLPELGFSIKSMLGSPSTLLNPGKTTNFVYKLKSFKGNIEEINGISTASKVKDRMKEILNNSKGFVYDEMGCQTFKQNLKKVDTVLPEIIAETLKLFYKGEGTTTKDLVKKLGEDENLKNKFDLTEKDFEYKIKEFLIAVALGMTPSREWDGMMSAHGGYLIVREDGEVVCYHLYNRDEFRDYLFNNTRFETASTTRYDFSKVYKNKNDYYINLNLQIRFIK